MLNQLLYIGLLLILLHVTTPVLYYVIILSKAKGRWPISPVDAGELPSVSVIIPTYNEGDIIVDKLNNVINQDYPISKIQIVISDSSTDDTPIKVKEWLRSHSNVNLVYLSSPRSGKGRALNEALKVANGDVIVTTDADSMWLRDSLPNAVRWLSSGEVGLVSCIKVPKGGGSVEDAYRSLYNVLRIGESKVYSTVVFHGELLAIKGSLLRSMGGFPVDIGADDSYTGVRVASMGYRAIVPDDVVCVEYIPSAGYGKWRVRRAQHLVQSFLKSARLPKPRRYRPIYYTEAYIHLVNPWLLPIGTLLLAASGSLLAYALIALGVVLLVWVPFRAWVIQQFLLMYAMVRNLWNKELIWEKVNKGM